MYTNKHHQEFINRLRNRENTYGSIFHLYNNQMLAVHLQNVGGLASAW